MTLIPVQEMRIPAADAASILSAFSSGFPQVLLIFTAQKGRHPGKNCATPMDNPNQTSLLKPPAYGFESSPDGKDVFLCRYKNLPGNFVSKMPTLTRRNLLLHFVRLPNG